MRNKCESGEQKWTKDVISDWESESGVFAVADLEPRREGDGDKVKETKRKTRQREKEAPVRGAAAVADALFAIQNWLWIVYVKINTGE